MSDRPDSTLDPTAPTWEDHVGFHAALLKLFSVEDAAALRHVARLIYDLGLEREQAFDPEETDSTTAAEMRCALAELEFQRAYLLDLSLKVERTSLDLPAARLCVLAAECAVAVGRVVDAIREGLR